jgi:tRNA threonylcarbamoyladenosine biosynthesis protein TsaB
VALDSKRAEPYLQTFGPDRTPATQPVARLASDYAEELLARDPGRPFLVAGDAGGGLAAEIAARGGVARLSHAAQRPDAAAVAALAAVAPLPAAFPAPVYVHPVATTTAKTMRPAPA